MARVLQLRRGTAAQNDNFTGLSGEVTFDTDSKTIRIHDGETLGGFPIARADNVSGFDIASVSDEFWTALFARLAPASRTVLTGDIVPLIGDSYVEYTFTTDLAPLYATAMLVCTAPDAGYAIGDVVSAFGFGSIPACNPNIIPGNGSVELRLMTGGDAPWVAHRDSGIRTNINPDNWGVKFSLYC